MGLGIVLVAVMVVLLAPFYPNKFQDKVVDTSRDLLLIGTTMISPNTRRKTDYEQKS
jgi:hypothetical protein